MTVQVSSYLCADYRKCVGKTMEAARSKGRVCGLSFAWVAGSNSAGGHGCLSIASVVCCHVEVSADHSSKGVLLNVSECDREALIMRRS